MELLNDFYTLTPRQASGDTLLFEVNFRADHLIYQAHFPKNPITPGVCLLQLVTDAVRTQNASAEVKKIKNLKFLHILSPNETCSVELSLKFPTASNDITFPVTAEIKSKETIFAQFSLVYSYETSNR